MDKKKTVSERLFEMANVLTKKADEIRTKTEGAEAHGITTKDKRFSKQSKK